MSATLLLAFATLGAADVARLRRTTRRMPAGATGPGNLLPTFIWLEGEGEGSSAASSTRTAAQPAEATVDDSCPDFIFDGLMPDLRVPSQELEPWSPIQL